MRQRIMRADIIWFDDGNAENIMLKLHAGYLFTTLYAAYWNGTMVVFRNDEPQVQILRYGARVYRFRQANGHWAKEESAP